MIRKFIFLLIFILSNIAYSAMKVEKSQYQFSDFVAFSNGVLIGYYNPMNSVFPSNDFKTAFGVISTDGILFPAGNTSQRPSTSSTYPILRYNTDLNLMELGRTVGGSNVWGKIVGTDTTKVDSVSFNSYSNNVNNRITGVETGKVDLVSFNSYSNDVNNRITTVETGKVDLVVFNSYSNDVNTIITTVLSNYSNNIDARITTVETGKVDLVTFNSYTNDVNGIITTVLTNYINNGYPVFEFDLIYFDPTSKDFMLGTEIELKAAYRNDWTNGVNNFLYWGDTLLFDTPSYTNFFTNSDMNLSVYYADWSGNDSRVYKEFVVGGTNYLTDAIGTEGYVTKIIVIPSRTNRLGQTYNWMYAENQDIVWTWRPRGKISDGPKNLQTNLLWYPCVPKEWRKTKLNIQN